MIEVSYFQSDSISLLTDIYFYLLRMRSDQTIQVSSMIHLSNIPLLLNICIEFTKLGTMHSMLIIHEILQSVHAQLLIVTLVSLHISLDLEVPIALN